MAKKEDLNHSLDAIRYHRRASDLKKKRGPGLRELIADRGLTLRGLAKQVETSPGHLSEVQCGKTAAGPKLTSKLARRFRKPVPEMRRILARSAA